MTVSVQPEDNSSPNATCSLRKQISSPNPERGKQPESGWLLESVPDSWCCWFSWIINVASGIYWVAEVSAVRWQRCYPGIGRSWWLILQPYAWCHHCGWQVRGYPLSNSALSRNALQGRFRHAAYRGSPLTPVPLRVGERNKCGESWPHAHCWNLQLQNLSACKAPNARGKTAWN